MPIPLFGLQAVGGKVYSLDDQTVVKDGAALDGTGGTAFVPYFISTLLGVARSLGYNKFRRFIQRTHHAGTATLRVTCVCDQRQGGASISRSLALADADVLTFPMNDAGSDFQVEVEITAYSAEVTLGDAAAYVVPRREARV